MQRSNTNVSSETSGKKFWHILIGESVSTGLAKAAVSLTVVALVFVGGWCLDSKPAFIIPLHQVTAIEGSMKAKKAWVWSNMRLTPDDKFPDRMNFDEHPDGDVYIVFDKLAMNLADRDSTERGFDVYCGTHKARVGTGNMRFERNFQVFTIFDQDGKREAEYWFYGELTRTDHMGFLPSTR